MQGTKATQERPTLHEGEGHADPCPKVTGGSFEIKRGRSILWRNSYSAEHHLSSINIHFSQLSKT